MRLGVARTVGAKPLLFCAAAVFSYELTCRTCGWRTVCGRDDAIAQAANRRPIASRAGSGARLGCGTLFVEAAPRMTCPICKEKALFAQPSRADRLAGDWQTAVLCEMCREPIAPERLEAIPGTKRCAACRESRESGNSTRIEAGLTARIAGRSWKCASAAALGLLATSAFAPAIRPAGYNAVQPSRWAI